MRGGTKIVGFCVAGLLSIAPGWAQSIAVVNPSFEILPTGGLPLQWAGVCRYSSFTPVPGWNLSGVDSGQYQCEPSYPDLAPPTDGITAVYFSGTLFQTVAATVQSGVIYTLLVDLEPTLIQEPRPGSAGLLVNGIRYTATPVAGVAPTPPNWGTYTATYIGLPADVGAAITIELNSPPRIYYDPYARFDNVRLSATPPEPAYTVSLLYDPLKAAKSGSTIPIKLRLLQGGVNVSSPSLVVHAVNLVRMDTTASSAVLENAGNANPDFDFRYVDGTPGYYIFNLKTTGLSTGTYRLKFTVNGLGDYTAPFDVK